MRDRRCRVDRDRARRGLLKHAPRSHRGRSISPDLVEDVLGDLGWRRIDRLARALRRGLRSACLVAVVVVAGSIAIEAADSAATSGTSGRLDDAAQRFGELPIEWREAGWSDWVGGIEVESEPRSVPDRLDSLVAAAPWSPV